MNSNQFLMADQLSGGKLKSTILAMRRKGDSYNRISAELYGKWGVSVTGAGIRKWVAKWENES